MKDEKQHLEKIERYLKRYKSQIEDEALPSPIRDKAKRLYEYYYNIWLDCSIVILPPFTKQQKQLIRRNRRRF